MLPWMRNRMSALALALLLGACTGSASDLRQTSRVSESPSSGWTTYSDSVLGWRARYPTTWTLQTYNRRQGNGSRGALFSSVAYHFIHSGAGTDHANTTAWDMSALPSTAVVVEFQRFTNSIYQIGPPLTGPETQLPLSPAYIASHSQSITLKNGGTRTWITVFHDGDRYPITETIEPRASTQDKEAAQRMIGSIQFVRRSETT